MQRIERYGVIAILLLLVTVLAVSMWGDDQQLNTDPSTPTLASAPAARRASTAERRPAQRTPGDQNSRRDTSRLKDRVDLTAGNRNALRAAGITAGNGQTPSATPRMNPVSDRSAGAGETKAFGRQSERAIADSARVANGSGSKLQPAVNRTPAPVAQQTDRSLVVQPDNSLVNASTVSTTGSKPLSLQDRAKRDHKNAGGSGASTASTWIVKSGDTLSEIASKALGSAKLWPQIVAANPTVDPNRLSVGTKLVLPTGTVVPQALIPAAAAAPKFETNGSGTYTVRAGDMLSIIAQRELGSAKRWQEIAALNPGVDPDRLSVGTRLILPRGASAAPASSALAVATTSDRTPKRSKVR